MQVVAILELAQRNQNAGARRDKIRVRRLAQMSLQVKRQLIMQRCKRACTLAF
jgi:hypothetical protein